MFVKVPSAQEKRPCNSWHYSRHDPFHIYNSFTPSPPERAKFPSAPIITTGIRRRRIPLFTHNGWLASDSEAKSPRRRGRMSPLPTDAWDSGDLEVPRARETGDDNATSRLEVHQRWIHSALYGRPGRDFGRHSGPKRPLQRPGTISAKPRQQRLSRNRPLAPMAGGGTEGALAGGDWPGQECGRRSQGQGVHGDGDRREAIRDLPRSAHRGDGWKTLLYPKPNRHFTKGPVTSPVIDGDRVYYIPLRNQDRRLGHDLPDCVPRRWKRSLAT